MRDSKRRFVEGETGGMAGGGGLKRPTLKQRPMETTARDTKPRIAANSSFFHPRQFYLPLHAPTRGSGMEYHEGGGGDGGGGTVSRGRRKRWRP